MIAGYLMKSPNTRIETNRRCVSRFWSCRRDLDGYRAYVSPFPVAVAHSNRSPFNRDVCASIGCIKFCQSLPADLSAE